MEKIEDDAINAKLKNEVYNIYNKRMFKELMDQSSDITQLQKKLYDLFLKLFDLTTRGNYVHHISQNEFYKLLEYFGDSTNPIDSYYSFLSEPVNGTPHLKINSDTAINVFPKKINTTRWIIKTLQDMESLLKSKNDIIEKRYVLLIYLIIATRKFIAFGCDFSFNGNRYYNKKTALKDNLPVNEGNTINAIPLKYADTLTPFYSIEIVDKVQKYIQDNANAIKDNTINIAVFGSFSDLDHSKTEIERLAQTGYFKDSQNNIYNIKITHFNIKQISEYSVYFEEDETQNNNRLQGNLYDIDFLTKVANKYNITLLLNLGCFSGRKKTGINKDKIYYEWDSVSITMTHYKINKFNLNFYYEHLKKLYEFVEWFNYSNGKDIFDNHLLSLLNSLEQKINNGHIVLLYSSLEIEEYIGLSKKLDRDLSYSFSGYDVRYPIYHPHDVFHENTIKEYNLYKTEDISNMLRLKEFKSIDTPSCLDNKINGYTRFYEGIPLSKHSVTLFDMIRIYSTYFFTKRFTSIYTGESINGEEFDFDFLKYCMESKIELDFSQINKYYAIYDKGYLDETKKGTRSKLIVNVYANHKSKYYNIIVDVVNAIFDQIQRYKNDFFETLISNLYPVMPEECYQIFKRECEVIVNTPKQTNEERKEIEGPQRKLVPNNQK